MTEAGDGALDQWYSLKRDKLRLICPSIDLPIRRLVTEQEFVADVINVLIGIPSYTFIYYKVLYNIRILGTQTLSLVVGSTIWF